VGSFIEFAEGKTHCPAGLAERAQEYTAKPEHGKGAIGGDGQPVQEGLFIPQDNAPVIGLLGKNGHDERDSHQRSEGVDDAHVFVWKTANVTRRRH